MIHCTSMNTPWLRNFSLHGDTAVLRIVRSSLERVKRGVFVVPQFPLSNWGKAMEKNSKFLESPGVLTLNLMPASSVLLGTLNDKPQVFGAGIMAFLEILNSLDRT